MKTCVLYLWKFGEILSFVRQQSMRHFRGMLIKEGNVKSQPSHWSQGNSDLIIFIDCSQYSLELQIQVQYMSKDSIPVRI